MPEAEEKHLLEGIPAVGSAQHFSAFDSAAERYDADFSETHLGRLLRGRVYDEVDSFIVPGTSMLELGCGTGIDAEHFAEQEIAVHATDGSPEMLAIAGRRLLASPAAGAIRLQHLDLNALPDPVDFLEVHNGGHRYDVVFSNFGAVNCVRDITNLAHWIATVTCAHGKVVLVCMGRWCPMEVLGHLLKRQPRAAFRRIHGTATVMISGRSVGIRYPSPAEVRQIFSPVFRQLHLAGIGVLLPPTDFSAVVGRHPALFEKLTRYERTIADRFPANYLNDHYVVVLEKQ